MTIRFLRPSRPLFALLMIAVLLLTGFAMRMPLSPALAQDDCSAAPVPRLVIDQRAIVEMADGGTLRLRDGAGLNAVAVGALFSGDGLDVLDGPTCRDGYNWWRVRTDGGLDGWAAEGLDSTYYLIPVEVPANTPPPTFTPSATATPSDTPPPTHTLTPTDTATPSATFTASATFTPSATLTPSNTPTATATPTATDTPRPTQTLTPTVDNACWTAPRPRLSTGAAGEVSGDVGALRLRDLPAIGAGEVGVLRPGAAFTVLEGPSCNSGYNWYRVELTDGTRGWVAEGESGAYWLQPANYATPPTVERVCLAWSDNRGLHLTTGGQPYDLPDSDTGRVLNLAVSPNGRFIAAVRQYPSTSELPIVLEIYDLSSGRRMVTAISSEAFGADATTAGDVILWTPDSSTVLVSGQAGSAAVTWSVSLFGEVLRLPLDEWQMVSVSPGQNVLALIQPDGWAAALYDLGSGALQTLSPTEAARSERNTQITTLTWLDATRTATLFGIVQADGTTSQRWVIYANLEDGSIDRQELTLPVGLAAWSPAGDRVAYTLTSGSLWLAEALNGTGSPLLPLSAGNVGGLRFSWAASGQAIYYENSYSQEPPAVLDLQSGAPISLGAPVEGGVWRYHWLDDTTLLAATDNVSSAMVNQPTSESFWLLDPVNDTADMLLMLDNVIFDTYSVNPDGCQLPPAEAE